MTKKSPQDQLKAEYSRLQTVLKRRLKPPYLCPRCHQEHAVWVKKTTSYSKGLFTVHYDLHCQYHCFSTTITSHSPATEAVDAYCDLCETFYKNKSIPEEQFLFTGGDNTSKKKEKKRLSPPTTTTEKKQPKPKGWWYKTGSDPTGLPALILTHLKTHNPTTLSELLSTITHKKDDKSALYTKSTMLASLSQLKSKNYINRTEDKISLKE